MTVNLLQFGMRVEIEAGKPGTIYRTIPGFLGYAAGDDGTIWSQWRRGKPGGLGDVWQPMKLSVNEPHPGYRRLYVRLKRDDGQFKIRYVHQLVALAFIGPVPEGMEVAHEDGNSLNNVPANLIYKTHDDNQGDMTRHERHFNVGAQHNARITAEQARDIRERFAAGESASQLSEETGIKPTTIYQIVTGRSWRNAGGPITNRGSDWKKMPQL